MARIFAAFVVTLLAVTSEITAAERVGFATHIRTSPQFVLPVLAAQEQGLWKQQGLDVEYVPFESTFAMNQAVVAGAVVMGTQGLTGVITAISRGIPEVMVADVMTQRFHIWVRSDSHIREPKDLRGAKVSITRFGGDLYPATLSVAKALGIEKEMKIVAAGGVMARVASLKAGATDATTAPVDTMAHLLTKGEVRQLLAIDDYVPKGVFGQTIFARRTFLEAKPEAARKGVKGYLSGAEYAVKNRDWAIRKMMTEADFGLSEDAAKMAYRELQYSDGRINLKRIDAAIDFLVENGLLAKDKIATKERIFAAGYAD